MKCLYKTNLVPFLLACGLCGLAATTRAQSVSAGGVDDLNTTAIDNFNPPVLVYQCDWIDQGLANAGFTAANGWNITYAGAANASFLATDLTVTNYSPWAVNQPTVTAPDGSVVAGTVNGQDAGGAIFGLQYTPQAGDPTNIHFIQAGNRIVNGGPDNVELDNSGGATPFYDTNGGHSGIGTLTGNGSWAISNPADFENEIDPYSTDSEFQTFIASDNFTGGVHNVTLYGGYWWGYNYSTSDIPEPSAYTLLAGGTAMAIVALKRRQQKTQAKASA